MSHETRVIIVKALRDNPGMGGEEIAHAINIPRRKIEGDITWLCKNSIIYAESMRGKSKWYAIEGMEPLAPQKAAGKGMHNYNSQTICEYHRAGNKRHGECMRCRDSVDVPQKKMGARLKKMFPRVFGVGAA